MASPTRAVGSGVRATRGWADRRSVQRFGEFWQALQEVGDALAEAQRAAKRADDSTWKTRNQRHWNIATVDDLAGVRRIRLHDVRHTYATLSLDSGVHAKIVSDRIGHAHEGITVQLYGHRSTGHDREAAELVAGLIRTRSDAPASDAG